ncbi:MAG TPA: PAS domain-containing protein [Thermoanaerobaculia bacterium]|jgi:PAS domain-containing protein
MSDPRLPEGVETLRAQTRFLARVIAATMVLMFVAVALPWLLRIIEIDLAPLAWTLTAFAVVHAALMLASERLATRTSMLRLLYAVPLAGVAFMALLWHHGGGVSHPALALMMALPVFAGAALPRRNFAFDVAVYSIVVVTVTAAITSPDFGWYIAQLGIPGAALIRLGAEDLVARDPFPGATTTPAAMFLFVATFALVQLAAAMVAARVSKMLRAREELVSRLGESEHETLPAIAMRATPAASLLVVASTGQIVQASKRFTQQMLLHNEAIVGRELFAFLTFADPDAARALLANGGSIPFCRYRVGSEERIASLQADAFEHEGTTYTSVVVNDLSDIAWLGAAAESIPEPLLVVGADARLRYANRAAGNLFDELYVGRDVAPLLGGDWWLRGSRTERIEIADRSFDAVATPVRLFGSDKASLVMLTNPETR